MRRKKGKWPIRDEIQDKSILRELEGLYQGKKNASRIRGM